MFDIEEAKYNGWNFLCKVEEYDDFASFWDDARKIFAEFPIEYYSKFIELVIDTYDNRGFTLQEFNAVFPYEEEE